jgi:hypothetical protein
MVKRKKDKRTNNHLQNTTQETKDRVTQTSQLEKKYAPALDNYGQSYFVRSDF